MLLLWRYGLPASELVTDVIQHSQSGKPNQSFTVPTVLRPGDYARVEVVDQGHMPPVPQSTPAAVAACAAAVERRGPRRVLERVTATNRSAPSRRSPYQLAADICGIGFKTAQGVLAGALLTRKSD
jgi:hypothetical protein